MNDVILENICKNKFDSLPPVYRSQNLVRFSMDWNLYDYQVEALKRALVFINEIQDREQLYQQFKINCMSNTDLWESLSVKEADMNFDFLSDFYPVKNNEISFKHLINRASFWMATGSGKTLVMIKLVELLFNLGKSGEIPEKNIMFLAPKENILRQIKDHVKRFNSNGSLQIDLRDLREFEHVKNIQQNLYENNKVVVFYYRADNITDENKEKLLDYQTVLYNSNWYVILDEAHKGNTDTSKRQQYYTLLSKNGILFNFSATFTDAIDIATTVFNFNLKRFLEDGYGKHIKVVDEEFKKFKSRVDDEFSQSEKRKIVLKSLLVFSAIKKQQENILSINGNLYHNPLLVTVANEVNTISADLKVFFEELASIATGDFEIKDAKNELLKSLTDSKEYQFKTGIIPGSFFSTLRDLEKSDIYKFVFNAESPGKIEYTRISGNSREVAFRLKSATDSGHFGLLVASDAIKWGDTVLEEYEFTDTPLTKSFFKDINKRSSKINLLLGSRIFSEGWDSNRPNVINFINIGVNEEAQKFVLQTTGRGVRIEPVKDSRKRLKYLENTEIIPEPFSEGDLIEILSKEIQTPIESLFLFATNKQVIQNIIEGLNTSSSGDVWTNIRGVEKNVINEELLIPLYRETNNQALPPYHISKSNYSQLLEFVGDSESNSDKTLLMKIPDYGSHSLIQTLNSIRQKSNFEFQPRQSDYSSPFQELLALNDHINNKPKTIDRFVPATNEIKHHNKIQAKNIDEQSLQQLEEKIVRCLNSTYSSTDEIMDAFKNDKISDAEFEREYEVLKNPDFKSDTHPVKINLSFLKEHYYKPILLAENGFEDLYRNIIKHESEIQFLTELENEAQNGLFADFDWWYFSKIEENIDEILIPYFDSKSQKFRKFYPDFIFWLKKNDTIFIHFVDPKGPVYQTNPNDKIDGFKNIFENNENLSNNENEIKISLHFYNEDMEEKIAPDYLDYWTNNLSDIFA